MSCKIPPSETLPGRHERPSLAPIACLAVTLLVLSSARRLSSKEDLSKDARLNLIRGLTSEIAVAKITLPRGSHGVLLDDKGNLDKTQADKELRANGPAIRPGMPVEITKIIFRGRRIVIEINGGGKTKKKWYQRIEVGVGNTTRPIASEPPVLAYGSWISLTLPDNRPDLTVERAKELLASVLDFSRHSPTVLYSPTVSPEIKAAIQKHQVIVGMDRDAVLSSKGPPDRRVREDKPDGSEEEDWIYGLPPHVLFVKFDGDTVVAVKQY